MLNGSPIIRMLPILLISGVQSCSVPEEARGIFYISVSHGISIELDWVPRASSEQADHLSRIVDSDDWSGSFPIFQLLNFRCGRHTVDRFADGRT